jgi:hypothetical protein
VEQGRMMMTMSGTYTDSTYEVKMRMEGESPMGPMTMTYHTTGQRLGSC